MNYERVWSALGSRRQRFMAYLNENYLKLQAGYLFPEIGRRVREFRDLFVDPAGLSPSDVLMLHFDRARVVIRPSGTEAKLKAYLETVVATADDLPAARAKADGELHELRAAVISMLRP